MLKLTDVKVNYGHINALKGISLEVNEGEIVTLIGSNGAGKTTTLRAISGLASQVSGSINFDGQELVGRRAASIVTAGLSHVPEGRQVFSDQTVEDNLVLGTFGSRKSKAQLNSLLEREYERFPVLAQRRHQLAGTLSGGEQQMLAMSRALMSNPRLLLLDEPSMGLAPLMVERIAATISTLRDQGVTILLVEQMASVALGIADRGYLLNTGEVQLGGTSKELQENPEVIRAYLGQ